MNTLKSSDNISNNNSNNHNNDNNNNNSNNNAPSLSLTNRSFGLDATSQLPTTSARAGVGQLKIFRQC